MSDTFNVTGAYDKPAYTAGVDTITASISGDDVLTTTVQETVGPLVLHLKAADGATTDLTLPTAPVTATVATPESVIIVGYTDTNPNPRTWSIAASGLSVSTPA